MTIRDSEQFRRAIVPRRHHPLESRLGIIAARPVVEDRDAKPAPVIAPVAPQPELQIEDQGI